MPLSRSQQGLFRPLVEKAWQTHSRLQQLDPRDKPARRRWYEHELYVACEVRSSHALNKTADFEAAMEHFEGIVGDSIFWAMRRYSGEARRIQHAVRSICESYEIDEHYAAAIAKQALRLPDDAPMPPLEHLAQGDRIIVIRALKIHLKREKARITSTFVVEPSAHVS